MISVLYKPRAPINRVPSVHPVAPSQFPRSSKLTVTGNSGPEPIRWENLGTGCPLVSRVAAESGLECGEPGSATQQAGCPEALPCPQGSQQMSLGKGRASHRAVPLSAGLGRKSTFLMPSRATLLLVITLSMSEGARDVGVGQVLPTLGGSSDQTLPGNVGQVEGASPSMPTEARSKPLGFCKKRKLPRPAS